MLLCMSHSPSNFRLHSTSFFLLRYSHPVIKWTWRTLKIANHELNIEAHAQLRQLIKTCASNPRWLQCIVNTEMNTSQLKKKKQQRYFPLIALHGPAIQLMFPG